MNPLRGATRNIVKQRYALLTPAGFVPSVVPGWTDCTPYVLISKGLGARFVQMLIDFASGAHGKGSTGNSEIFAYVVKGECRANDHALSVGEYIFLPPRSDYEFRSNAGQLLVFQKAYEPLACTNPPELLTGNEQKIDEQPFLGDPRTRLKVLLPENAAFDMAVNIFTYDPGATLPFVETHIMEHGLLMLEGTGVYRLDSDWHPVQAGDAIWMAPYCPQWFVAAGPSPARYIYYKDVNRSPYDPTQDKS
jgi:(S)-ureidoglycine aminohydrolase